VKLATRGCRRKFEELDQGGNKWKPTAKQLSKWIGALLLICVILPFGHCASAESKYGGDRWYGDGTRLERTVPNATGEDFTKHQHRRVVVLQQIRPDTFDAPVISIRGVYGRGTSSGFEPLVKQELTSNFGSDRLGRKRIEAWIVYSDGQRGGPIAPLLTPTEDSQRGPTSTRRDDWRAPDRRPGSFLFAAASSRDVPLPAAEHVQGVDQAAASVTGSRSSQPWWERQRPRAAAFSDQRQCR